MHNCISVDWLQCHVKVPRKDFENLFAAIPVSIQDKDGNWKVEKVQSTELKELDNRYMLERTGFQTRNFKAIYEIRDRVTNEEIAVLASEPRSEMCMKEDSGLIKIINKYLYQKNLLHFVQQIFHDLQLTLINVTRFDIAADFERFDTIECQEFIEMFTNRLFIKKTAAKMKMMGDSWSVDKGKMTGGISSLKFGLETSDVNYYLYNKSLELKQVKDKPWIRDHWKANGWNEKTDVWRLEFSLHSNTDGVMYVDEHGEIRCFQFKDLSLLLDNLDKVYSHYFNKHFQFVRAEKTKKGNFKKQSRCDRVVLFEHLKFEGVKISLSDKKDAGRSAKTFAKKLMQFNQELRGQDFNLAIAGNEMFTYTIMKHDLQTWMEKKLPGAHLSPNIVDLVNRGRQSQLVIIAMEDKPQPANVFFSAEKQALLLQQQQYDALVSKFAIVPDGKILHYDNNGNCLGYCECPF